VQFAKKMSWEMPPAIRMSGRPWCCNFFQIKNSILWKFLF